jgi:hypothetical protein
MNYLVIKDNTVNQICTSTEDLLNYLDVKITNNGVIDVNGKQLPTSYNMQEFTKQEVIMDMFRILWLR